MVNIQKCRHPIWKRYDLGFDRGWCCAACKQMQDAERCEHCGRMAIAKVIGTHAEFRCLSCNHSKYVQVSDRYIDPEDVAEWL